MIEARSPSNVRLHDPLSDVTRKERKYLLLVSAIGLIMLKTSLVPTKIAALGIEFSQIDQNILLKAVGIIVLYFLCAFILYALSDFVSWRLEFYSAKGEAILEQLRKHREFENLAGDRKEEITHQTSGVYAGIKKFDETESRYEEFFLVKSAKPVSLFRAIFEFIVPIVFGTIAVIQLFVA